MQNQAAQDASIPQRITASTQERLKKEQAAQRAQLIAANPNLAREMGVSEKEIEEAISTSASARKLQ